MRRGHAVAALHTHLGHSRGFTVVELMVAATLSLLLLGGVVTIFVSSRASYETTDRLSRIQESGRFALDQIVADVRSAGYVGCARVPTYLSSALNSTADVRWNFLDAPVRGYQNTGPGSYAPALAAAIVPSAATDSDVLLIRRPKPESQPLRLQADLPASTADIVVPDDPSAGLQANDIALIYSCEAQTYFQVQSYAGGVIRHAAGGAVTETATLSAAPGNLTGDLSYLYRRNAEVVPVQTVIYYVRPSTAGPAGSNSLWRRIGANTPEELVEGVEQMQVRLGVDTTGDGVVDNYVTADAVANWNNVYSVEVALLVRSLDGYGRDRDTEQYQLLDVLVPAANDTRLREVFTATTGIRNRMRVN